MKIDASASQFQSLTIQIEAPNQDTFQLDAIIIQKMEGLGIAVEFSTEAGNTVEKIIQLGLQHPDKHPPPENDPKISISSPDNNDPGQDRQDQIITPDNLRQQIEQMTSAQKRQAALHGHKTMRMLLIRDQNKTIHPFVLKNPAITLDEIEQISRIPSVNPEVLRIIAKSNEWTRLTTVSRNLVRNPKTPNKEALMLLSKLPVSELRALSKSSHVRTSIQQAARKKLFQPK